MPRLLARWIPLVFVFVSFIFFTTFFIRTPDHPFVKSVANWFPQNPLDIPLTSSSSPTVNDDDDEATTHWPQRAKRVREAFIHAYKGYRTYAWPSDELLPVSGSRVNNFNGWGVTLFDALDTMWLMGLHDMFREAVGLVAKSTFELDQYKYAPFFETVIRCLGGLLSAYSLSGEPILLMRADDLGMKLLPAFNTESGLPMFAVNTVSGKTKQGWNPYVLWSEAFSNQLEYKLLAHYTGRSIYYNKTESVMQILYHANISDGLFPTHWDIKSGHPTNNHHTVGAYADSAHEYLLKQWLLTGRSEPNPRDLYLQSVNGILRNLTYITPRRKLLYVTDISNGKPSHTFEHLSCFLPGLLALGVYTLPDMAAQDKELHMWAAKGLAYTCYITYADHATGLGPDEMKMSRWYPDDLEGSWLAQLDIWEMQERPGAAPPGLQESPPATTERDYHNLKNSYLLRPETIESFYILWRVTGEEKWRERGWEIFEAIEMHARTEYGYASIAAVDSIPVYLKDDMPSFFLAETLKYFYLLFTDDDILPLTEWVLNTEAHPFPIFDWNSWEKEEYGVSG